MKLDNDNISLLKRSLRVHPCVINGKQTLIYERRLKYKHPFLYRALVEYAESYGYQIKEDRRADFIEGIKRVNEPSRANVITIMVLTASIISQNVFAGSNDFIDQVDLSEKSEQVQIYPRIDLQTSSFATSEQLMISLLEWINVHTEFEYKNTYLPSLVFVNSQNIAEIAFGKSLPADIDAMSLNIMGLYNFNEKTIYLLDSVDLKTEAGRAILLHELVHYLQYEEKIDKEIECKNELEALAYSIEAQYLHEHNQGHNINQKFIHNVSSCH